MKLRRIHAAFTLIELLVVIAIIGLIAALSVATLTGFRKGDVMLAATRLMLDGAARARQLAISQHTTVYLVFVPPSYWNDPAYVGSLGAGKLTFGDRIAATNLVDKEFTGFTFVSLRTLADQPGQYTPHYLSAWQSLPEKSFIATNKFWYSNLLPAVSYYTIITNQITLQGYNIYGFNISTNIPFPMESTLANNATRPYPAIPYIAFNYLGQLTTEALSPAPLQQDEYIPLVHGGVLTGVDPATKRPQFFAPSAQEEPAGSSTNTAYNIIHIDWLTGRARLEHQQVK